MVRFTALVIHIAASLVWGVGMYFLWQLPGRRRRRSGPDLGRGESGERKTRE
ncbi:MAG: hypothetical protein ACLFRY_15935 [Spirochaetia bacterium]